jgi:hypothetical protein
MGKRMQYSSEIKWKAVRMKNEGYTTAQVI